MSSLPSPSPAIGSHPVEDSVLVKVSNMLENQWSNWLPCQLNEVKRVPLIVIPLLSNLPTSTHINIYLASKHLEYVTILPWCEGVSLVQALMLVGPPCSRSRYDQGGSFHQQHAPLAKESFAEVPVKPHGHYSHA